MNYEKTNEGNFEDKCKVRYKIITSLQFNFVFIKTAWQIGLHEPKPLLGLSSSYNTYAVMQGIE